MAGRGAAPRVPRLPEPQIYYFPCVNCKRVPALPRFPTPPPLAQPQQRRATRSSRRKHGRSSPLRLEAGGGSAREGKGDKGRQPGAPQTWRWRTLAPLYAHILDFSGRNACVRTARRGAARGACCHLKLQRSRGLLCRAQVVARCPLHEFLCGWS